MKHATRLMFGLFALFQMGNTCGEPLLDDSLFEAWCGDQLCEWDVDEGQVEKTPTWHEDDFGVALLGARTTISQRSEKSFDCFDVDLLTDIEPGTTVVLEMDFADDGAVEYSQPIDGRDWKRLEYQVTPPADYESVRISVRKLNTGRAVLGRIRIGNGLDCVGEPLELK